MGEGALILCEGGERWSTQRQALVDISASQVRVYGQCPALAAATVLPGAPRRRSAGPTAEALFRRDVGSAAHVLLAAANRRLALGLEVDREHLFARHWNPSPFSADRRAVARDLAEQYLWQYLHLVDEQHLRIVTVEQDVWAMGVVRADDDTPAVRVRLKGRIDCLARRGDEVLALDAKTARVLPTADELARDPSSTLYYLLATRFLEAQGDRSPVVVAQLALHSGASVEVRLEPDELRSGRAVVRRLALALVGAADHPRTPGAHCTYCPLNADCPAAPLAAFGPRGADGDDDIVL